MFKIDLDAVNKVGQPPGTAAALRNLQSSGSKFRKSTAFPLSQIYHSMERKRNELLISINCSKAINNEHYRELMDIMESS